MYKELLKIITSALFPSNISFSPSKSTSAISHIVKTLVPESKRGKVE